MAIWGKKPTAVIRTQASKPDKSIHWQVYLKLFLLVIGLIGGYVLYNNWSNWLILLDKHPIRSYALTHKTEFTTDNDLRMVLGQEPKLQGYFAQDVQQISEKLLTISWIKDVIVRKIYPDRLNITLFEHRPVAIWNEQKLLSAEGDIFTLPKERFDPKGLPILFGPDSQANEVLQAWYKIQKDLASRQLVLKSITTDVRGAWTIRLDNGIELRLGRGDWLPKIDRFVSIFPEIDVPEGKRLAYVDLRYKNGVAIGFSP